MFILLRNSRTLLGDLPTFLLEFYHEQNSPNTEIVWTMIVSSRICADLKGQSLANL